MSAQSDDKHSSACQHCTPEYYGLFAHDDDDEYYDQSMKNLLLEKFMIPQDIVDKMMADLIADRKMRASENNKHTRDT